MKSLAYIAVMALICLYVGYKQGVRDKESAVVAVTKELDDEKRINTRCDQVLNTCLYWQARITTSLDNVESACITEQVILERLKSLMYPKK